MKPQSAKNKGRRFQHQVGRAIADLLGVEYGRDHPVQGRGMGQSGTDIIIESHLRHRFPFAVECKAQERWNIREWITQARANADGCDWLLVVKANRVDPIVIMDFDVFMKLMRKVQYETSETDGT